MAYEIEEREENKISKKESNENVERRIFELEYKMASMKQLVKDDEWKRKKAGGSFQEGEKYTAGKLATELGVRSATYLNERLVQLGFQVKKNGAWQPTPQYENGGYYVVSERKNKREGNYHRSQSYFTEKGRRMVLALLKEDVKF